MIPPIILFIFVLSLLIFIHELGHFISARKFGIDVEEFGLGIPPRIFGKKIGKTIYSINWLPIGGFVRIKGEDFQEYSPKDKGNFINKKPWQKTVVLLAGIFMNIIFAIFLFYVSLSMNGWKSNPILLMGDFEFKYGETVEIPNVVVFISSDSPAEKGGLQFADQIISLGYGEESVTPKTVNDVRNFISNKEGKAIDVKTRNLNTEVVSNHVVVPEYSELINAPALGVSLGDGIYLSYKKPIDTLAAGFLHSANVVDYSFFAFSNLIKESISSKDISAVSQGIAGPIGIFGAIKLVIESGGPRVIAAVLDLVALLSLSLAIMNLLPIPALDGGRLVFVAIEWVTGKRPSPRLEEKAHRVGYIFLLFLLLVITLKDIIQLF